MNSMIRGFLIYIAIIIAVRLMGKRQIGELQPGELAITILLSEVAAMPLQGDDYPLITSLMLIFLFVGLEVISSVLSLKSNGYRSLIQGHNIMIIRDGKLLEENLRKIRYSIDDIFGSLRMKDIFDISQVEYAYIETNGSMSVKLKADYAPVTPKEIGLKCKVEALPCLVICDGKIISREFDTCNMTKKKVLAILETRNLRLKDVLLMTAERNGKVNIVVKGGNAV